MAGTLNSSAIVTTLSGSPIFQPLVNWIGGGKSASFPLGVPLSIHARIVSRSSGLRRRSLLNWPKRGSACHGGIRSSTMASRIRVVRFRASSKVSSENGPISPGRWHS